MHFMIRTVLIFVFIPHLVLRHKASMDKSKTLARIFISYTTKKNNIIHSSTCSMLFTDLFQTGACTTM